MGPDNEASLGTHEQCNLCNRSKGENQVGKTPLQKEITENPVRDWRSLQLEKMSPQTGTRKVIMKEHHWSMKKSQICHQKENC